MSKLKRFYLITDSIAQLSSPCKTEDIVDRDKGDKDEKNKHADLMRGLLKRGLDLPAKDLFQKDKQKPAAVERGDRKDI